MKVTIDISKMQLMKALALCDQIYHLSEDEMEEFVTKYGNEEISIGDCNNTETLKQLRLSVTLLTVGYIAEKECQ